MWYRGLKVYRNVEASLWFLKATPSNCGDTLRALTTKSVKGNLLMARVMTSGMVKTLKIGQSAAKSLNKKKVKQDTSLFM